MSIKIQFCENERDEQLWIHNIYRQKDPEDPTKTLDLLDKSLEEPGEYLIVGDFNLHHPQWGGVHSTTDTLSDTLLGMIYQRGLELLLPQGTPTRMAGTSATTIDLSMATADTASRVEFCDIWSRLTMIRITDQY